MNEAFLSGTQIEDAAGQYTDAVASSGIESAAFDPAQPPSPSFNEVAFRLGIEPGSVVFELPAEQVGSKQLVTAGAATSLGAFPGLRVVVGMEVPARTGGARDVFTPGVVLPSGDIACLLNGADALTTESALAQATTRPLSDFQQGLLTRLYGLHNAGVGEHHKTDATTNVGDTVDAVIVAVTDPSQAARLHGTVHGYLDRGVAQSISQNGASAIAVDGRLRPDNPVIVPAAAAKRIIVAREHQLPPADAVVTLGVGIFTVAITLAAVRSQQSLGRPQPNLRAGMASLLQ
jgi:hypothetical protein